MAFFTKEEIITRMQALRAELGDGVRADYNLALIILGSALFEKRLRSGEDYGSHPVTVGMRNTHSTTKKIIGILHDVVEDSDWTVDDLRRCGFSERIVKGVEAMTHDDENEPYFDAIERCSLNNDGRDKKIEDLKHNLDQSRTSTLVSPKDIDLIDRYKISHAFLVAVKKKEVTAGSSIPAFARAAGKKFGNPARVEELIKKYSSHP